MYFATTENKMLYRIDAELRTPAGFCTGDLVENTGEEAAGWGGRTLKAAYCTSSSKSSELQMPMVFRKRREGGK